MLKWKKSLPLALAALVFLGVSPVTSAVAAEEFPVRYQSVYPGPHVINLRVLQPWTQEMTEASKGRLSVEYFTSGAIIKMEDVLKAVRNGTLDMAAYTTTTLIGEFPHLTTVGQAFLARDSVHGTRIVWEMYRQMPEVKKELEKDVRFLTMWTSDRAGLFSTTGPVLSPDDLKGKRVLFWSGSQGDQIKQWGGIPVQVSINDTYVALQRGMGEVLFAPLPAGTSQKIMEVAKNITVLPVNVGTIAMGMNKDYFDDLPDDLQQFLLDNTGEALAMRIARELRDSTDRDIETMSAAGCAVHHLTDEQIAVFAGYLKDSDSAFWINQMKRYGEPDGAAWLPRVRAIAESIAAD